jgi:hypothetical protein
MKKILITVFAIVLGLCVHAQKIAAEKVPAAVIRAFKAKFPAAEKVKWEMEDKKDYEAAFTLNKTEQSAAFNAEGKWMETETEIKTSELPQTVRDAVSKDYAGYKITEASRIEDIKHGNCFETEIKKEKQMYAVLYSPDGKKLETETLKNDDEKKEGKDKD